VFVNTNKPLHVSVLFIRPSSEGHTPCFVPLLCLPLICVFEYIHGMWLYAYIIYLCVCLMLLSVEVCLWTVS